MKLELRPGDAVAVTFAETDGEITVSWNRKGTKIQVHADLPDSTGREGVIYEEDGELDLDCYGGKKEKVDRGPKADPTEEAQKLWAHLVSEHAMILDPVTDLKELVGEHDHEHEGPGTIRNHPKDSRKYSMEKLKKVLSE